MSILTFLPWRLWNLIVSHNPIWRCVSILNTLGSVKAPLTSGPAQLRHRSRAFSVPFDPTVTLFIIPARQFIEADHVLRTTSK